MLDAKLGVSRQTDTAESGVKISSRDELPAVKYNRLLMKKEIRGSRQEWAMIKSQRKSKYSNIPEGDIPVIDFFRLAIIVISIQHTFIALEMVAQMIFL